MWWVLIIKDVCLPCQLVRLGMREKKYERVSGIQVIAISTDLVSQECKSFKL